MDSLAFIGTFQNFNSQITRKLLLFGTKEREGIFQESRRMVCTADKGLLVNGCNDERYSWKVFGQFQREATMRMHNPLHPGRIIKVAIEAIPMSVTGFAAHIGVSRATLSRVLNGRAGVAPEMSIKVSEAFEQDSPEIWFNLQNDYDFWQAVNAKAGRRKVEPLQAAAA